MYQKIMVPLDGSDLAECVLPHLEAIASGCRITHVVLIRVVDPLLLPASVPARGGFGFTEKDREKLEQRSKSAALEYLEKVERRLSISGAAFSHHVLEGKVSETLAGYAENNDIDMILIASHGRSGVSRWLLGSVADRIMRSSCVPVLMVRAPGCIPGFEREPR